MMKLATFLAGTIAFTAFHAQAATLVMRAADIKAGVVVHINAYGSPRYEVAALQALGVRRVRVDAPQPEYLSAGNGYDALCSAGIKITPFMNGWINPTDDSSPHAEFAATKTLEQRHPGCIEAIEGPNEINNFPISYNGVKASNGAQLFQRAMYDRVKSDDVLGHIPVIAYTDEHPVGSISDLANVHAYVGSWWQDYEIAQVAPQMVRGKPWAATEYGWPTPSTSNSRSVTEGVQAQRVVAGLCAMAAAGFNPAFLYELRDEGNSTADNEEHFGLFHTDWSPKLAAVYLANFLAAARDNGDNAATFTPKPLTVSFADPAVKSLLIAKSDGSYLLLFWMNKHLGDAPSTVGWSMSAVRTMTGIHIADGKQVTYGRAAQVIGYVFHDTDALSMVRISAN